MLRKVMTGALVVVILSAANMTGAAAASQLPYYKYASNTAHGTIKIIQPTGDVIFRDSVLVSVQVFDDAAVSLSLYKIDTSKLGEAKVDTLKLEEFGDKGTRVYGPDKIEQGKKLKFYQKRIQNLSPGKYVLVFEVKDGNKKDIITKEFTLKNKEEEINKTLNSIQNTNPLNNLLD